LRFWLQLALRAGVIVVGGTLLVFSVAFLIAFAGAIFTNPSTVFAYLVAAVILGGIWYGYIEAASFVGSFLKRTDLAPKRKRGRPPKF